MAVLVALTVGLVFWIAGWALGLKALDAFIVTVALTLAAYVYTLVLPQVRRLLGVD